MPSENDYKAFVDDYLNTRDRLTAVEDQVERILELIKGISMDLNGGSVEEKVSSSEGTSDRATRRTVTRNVDSNGE